MNAPETMSKSKASGGLNFKLRKGLDLPIAGQPVQEIKDHKDVSTVAVLGSDYIGLKPKVVVEEGDVIGAGQAIFFNKETPDVKVVSPVSGRVKAINRGARRVLLSVEVEIDDSAADALDFSDLGGGDTREGLIEKLATAGLWTSFKARPYSKVPATDANPAAIFVTAMDSEPLAPNAELIIARDNDAFEAGLAAIAKLTDGNTYLCHETGASIPGANVDGVTPASFSGKHPSGLPGTHIHFLDPPTGNKSVWSIWYQDVIAIGKLLQTGKINSSRVISVGGPLAKSPRLIETVAGASLAELAADEVAEDLPTRLISGSVLSGHAGEPVVSYLSRYARQLTIIEEDHKQIPFGWIRPMAKKFAFQPVLGSAPMKKLYDLTSNLNGGRRAMVPVGTFETLMPQDYLPTQLLRALLVMDTDVAQELGALELDEEDLGLVTFACPAKYEYGMALRDCLTKIEKEG